MRAWPVALLASVAPSCVTTDLSEEPTGPVAAHSVVIPFDHGGAGRRDPVAEYYGSVMRLLQDAVQDRDPEAVRFLCLQHDTPAAPAWARTQLARYLGIASVLEIEAFIAAEASVELRVDDTPVLGALVPLVLRVPSGAPHPARIEPAGRGRFHVQLEIADYDCLGGHVERSFSEFLDLVEPVELATDGIELPFDVGALPPEGVRRTLRCRIGLLPGDVVVDGERLPNRATLCSEAVFTMFPRGIEPIAESPLRTLDNALRSGRTEHLDHVYLAALLMPEADREAALELLIRRVRVADSVLARASMAALAVLTDAEISVDDRAGWLRWWLRRQSPSETVR